jgi:hypothetical protein
MRGEDWTPEEVRAIVRDYFAMLALELTGQTYSKTRHREQLRKWLSGRTDGSVEFKHMNISAVLKDAGFPYIMGYKPATNRQQLLEDLVLEHVASDRQLSDIASADADRPVVAPEVDDILGVEQAPPEVEESVGPPRTWIQRPRLGTNFFEREAANRSLGLAGEKLVLQFERARLVRAGVPALAERVDHVSTTQGDGLGYDIHSYEQDGSDRLIEVKTTKYGDRVPFFVSRNEVAASDRHGDRYYLYRVHTFRSDPHLFLLRGSLKATCDLDPSTFLARVKRASLAGSG